MSDLVVELNAITKRYAGHTAVRELSLAVPRGSIYGLLGPNGAGKTTTIRMILGIIVPDEGRVSLFGGSTSGRDASHRIGYLPEERGLYRKMRVLDLLIFLAEAKGVARTAARRDALQWLERLGLAEWGQHKVDALSKGMQQKVQFVSTVLHQPELVVLDEVFAGLDPVNSQVMKDAIVELAKGGTTILFSTHVMEQAERLCESVCIIARGTKVLDGVLADIKRGYGGRHVTVAVERRDGEVDRILADESLVARSDSYGQYAEIELAGAVDPQQLLRRLVDGGVRVTRFEVTEPSLHKIFIDRVGSAVGTESERRSEGAPA